MRNFTVPFDMDFEDKIIGGKLSLRQAGWVLIPAGLLVFSLMNPAAYIKITEDGQHITEYWKIIMRILIFTIAEIIGLAMAFYKIHEITLDKYIFKSLKYMYEKTTIKFYE